MRFKKLAGYGTLVACGLGAAWAAENNLNIPLLFAQEARQGEKEPVTTERGKVKALLTNDHDDVDGMLLENGVHIHFPPHMGERISAVVNVGDNIEVQGRSETTPAGEKVFEITQLVSGKETIQIEHPRPKPRPRGPRAEQPMNASGRVTEFARNPQGEVDGLILQDETVVKFPPHQAAELQELVSVGSQATIRGGRHVTPQGDVHLHADRIEADGKVIERDGPRHAGRGAPTDLEVDGPTNADLLRELQEIRRLLEKQVKP